MSSGHDPGPHPRNRDQESSGPNLALIYGLLGAALLLAIGIALLVVFPFYRRH